MNRLRGLTAELGFMPATTDEAANERHRRHNKNADYWLARSHRFDYLRHPPQKRRAWGEVPDRAARVFKECCLVAGAHGLVSAASFRSLPGRHR
jgi:hypothetical protein